MDELLKAQLQATLDMIPAFTWLAAPSGALLFVNSRCADYLGLPKDHPLRFGTVTGAAWIDEKRSEEHTSELQSRQYLVCRLLLGKHHVAQSDHSTVMLDSV